MAIGAIIGAAASIGGGLLASSSAKKSAREQQRAQEEANAKYLEATTTNATRQQAWDKEIAQDNFATNVRATDMEYNGTVAGLNLQGKALENLRGQTAASYGHEIAFKADMSQMELDNLLRTTQERARISTFMNVEGYKARKAAVFEAIDLENQAASMQASTATRKGQEAMSETARMADRAAASARVAAGESGAAGSSMYTRMVVANASLEGEQMASIKGDVADEFRSINHGLMVAASNANSDLRMATLQYQGEAMGISADVAKAARDAEMFVKDTNSQIENLLMQQVFDLEAIDLEGENLNLSQEQLTERRNFQMELLNSEKATADKFADFIFDQTITAAEAQSSAGDALAAAQASATKRAANTSFFTSVLGAGGNLLGSYASQKAGTASMKSKLTVG